MKTRVLLGVVAALVSTSAFAAEQTWTGAISDKMCSADHKKMRTQMSDRDCTITCSKGGAPYVLIVDGKAYGLTNHDADLRTHAGHLVNVTGELKGNTIRVSKVEMPKE